MPRAGIHPGHMSQKCLMHIPIILRDRRNIGFLLGNVRLNTSNLFLHFFIQSLLLLHVKPRQKIICHQDHIDIGRVNPEAFHIFFRKLCRTAVPVAIGKQNIKVIRLKPRSLQKFLNQFRHLMAEYRAHDTDSVCSIYFPWQ